MQPGFTAFDIKKLLGTEIGTETGLGHHVITELQCSAGGHYRITAMGNIGKWPAMHQRRVVFQRLHQVRLECVAQQRSHGTGNIELPDGNGFTFTRVTDDNVANSLCQVIQAIRKAKNCHDFGRHGNIVARLSWNAVAGTTQTTGNITQGSVVHINNASPGDPSLINIQPVIPVNVIVDHCR